MAAKLNEIAVVYSSDAHYSMPKGANILGLQDLVIPVDESSRMWDLTALDQQLKEAENSGIRFLIITLNMGTTMFGSVDKIDAIIEVLNRYNFDYKIHIDGAFGGFIYPFTNEANPLNFSHPAVNSITVDAHKMLQAPYGTGIFLIRKGWMQYTTCEEAKYVSGLDSTICGSRSGANAIATWMIIMGYGSEGWTNNCKNLYSRTLKLCEGLDELGINYFHQEFMNIVTIKASDIPADIAHKYHLVPDNQDKPNWFKIVVMPHVTSDMVERFLNNLRLQIWVNA
jgi:glutamate/tyrosine decarboxylase-like PLP-dependent enzyme